MITKIQYEFLLEFKEKCYENMEKVEWLNYWERARLDFKNMAILLSKHKELSPSDPFILGDNNDDDDDIFDNSLPQINDAIISLIKEYIKKINMNEYIEYFAPKNFGLTAKCVNDMNEYEQYNEHDISKTLDKKLGKISNDINALIYVYKTSNITQNQHLLAISNEFVSMLKQDKLEIDSLNSISKNIEELRLMVITNTEDKEKYDEAVCFARKIIRKNSWIFWLVIAVMLIISIIIGTCLVFKFKGQEHPIAWEFIFVVIPILADVVLGLLKNIFIKTEEEYIKKYLNEH